MFPSCPSLVQPSRWKVPDAGCLKLNVDAGLRVGGCFAGAGGVVRDLNGTVIACFAKKLVGSFSPYVAECLALREGLEFATACGLQISVVETDALAVVQAVYSSETFDDAELIISDIRKGLNQVTGDTLCCHIPCSENIVVHLLVNSVFSFDEFVGLDVVPWHIRGDILVDLAS